MFNDQERSMITAHSSCLSNQRANKYSLSRSVGKEVSGPESIRFYASCLRSDIEYRTARQVITGLLSNVLPDLPDHGGDHREGEDNSDQDLRR